MLQYILKLLLKFWEGNDTPRRSEPANEENIEENMKVQPQFNRKSEDEKMRLSRLLGAVKRYLSDNQVAEIDIGYLHENTEGLR